MDLVLHNAWCQINTERGYRYLDDAGKVMNFFDQEFDQMSVSVEGLSMKKEGAVLAEVRVSSTNVWTSFKAPDTLQLAIDQSWRVFKEVCGLLDVASASRLGMRVQYQHPLDAKEADRVISRTAKRLLPQPILRLGEPKDFAIATELAINPKLSLNLKYVPGRRAETADPDLPERVLLYDADFFHKGEGIPIATFRAFGRDTAEWIKGHFTELAGQLTEGSR
jgi:hypothetical protein